MGSRYIDSAADTEFGFIMPQLMVDPVSEPSVITPLSREQQPIQRVTAPSPEPVKEFMPPAPTPKPVKESTPPAPTPKPIYRFTPLVKLGPPQRKETPKRPRVAIKRGTGLVAPPAKLGLPEKKETPATVAPVAVTPESEKQSGVKKFYEEHKKPILITGGIAGSLLILKMIW